MFPSKVSVAWSDTWTRPKSLRKEFNARVPPMTLVSYPTLHCQNALDGIGYRLTGNGSHAHHRRNEVYPPVAHLRRVTAVVGMKIEPHLEDRQRPNKRRTLQRQSPDCFLTRQTRQDRRGSLVETAMLLSVLIRPLMYGTYSVSPLRRQLSPLHRA